MTRMLLLVIPFLFMTMIPAQLLAYKPTSPPTPYHDGHFQVQEGDKVYVCEDGEKGPFRMLSRMEGKCGCGKDLVEGEVIKVEKGAVTVMINGREHQLSTIGKYICGGCGEDCSCEAISQAPTKCPCDGDVDMTPAGSW